MRPTSGRGGGTLCCKIGGGVALVSFLAGLEEGMSRLLGLDAGLGSRAMTGVPEPAVGSVACLSGCSSIEGASTVAFGFTFRTVLAFKEVLFILRSSISPSSASTLLATPSPLLALLTLQDASVSRELFAGTGCCTYFDRESG